MKTTLSRFIAVLMLVIPGLIATYGFLAMKDAFLHNLERQRRTLMCYGGSSQLV